MNKNIIKNIASIHSVMHKQIAFANVRDEITAIPTEILPEKGRGTFQRIRNGNFVVRFNIVTEEYSFHRVYNAKELVCVDNDGLINKVLKVKKFKKFLENINSNFIDTRKHSLIKINDKK